jgi:putative flippase GtrA
MDTTGLTSFIRFVVCGAGVGLLSSGAMLLLAGPIPFAAANALVTVVSTLLATELHSRFTFGGEGRASWRVHLKSGLTLAVAYLFTTGAMLVLHAVRPDAGRWWEQAVYLGASGLAGLGRFAVLRLVVFARDWKVPTASVVMSVT